MIEIDRRRLITMAGAGAGLLLAGNAQAVCPVEEEGDSPGGGCDAWGQLATEEAPDEEGNDARFSPDYLCVLYIKFADDKTLKIRTAYVKPLKPFNVASVVTPILINMRNNSNVSAIRKEDDLESFTFGSQHLLVIYIDNDPDRLGFDDRFGRDYIVQFTRFLGSDPKKEAKENHAFFNLNPFEIPNPGPLKSSVAYQLEYWNTDDEANPIDPDPTCSSTHFIYSMNIHLKMAVKTSRGQVFWIPIILDPDTGNTGGIP